jgi:hypothetical protein
MAMSTASPAFILYRILGNDLPGRHGADQTLENLRFILRYEAALADCDKRWIVNRITDPERERAVIEVLEAHAQKYARVPFDLAEYARQPFDIGDLPRAFYLTSAQQPAHRFLRARALEYPFRYKNLYAMNNNGARNLALRLGRQEARWVLPWDGACFISPAAWDAIRAAAEAQGDAKYLLVPMVRIDDNARLLDPTYRPEPNEEPQIVFRADATEVFDEAMRYGNNPKVALLQRLAVPGPWDQWGAVPWEPVRVERATEAGQWRWAGWVARLASRAPEAETSDEQRFERRITGIVGFLSGLDERVMRSRFRATDPIHYNESTLESLAARWRQGQALALIEELLARADQALAEGVFSVRDKPTRAPSGDALDYYSVAPYFSPDAASPGGLAYHDGRRIPAADLDSPESRRYDRGRWQAMVDNGMALALAWRITGDIRYARHGAELMRAWFIDPATRMNPHMAFAQCIPGESGATRGFGLIETKDIHYFLDGVRLIERAGVLATAERDAFRDWCRQYLRWLLGSAQGRAMLRHGNNHSTFYLLQVAALAAYLDDAQALLFALRAGLMLAAQQMHQDGTQAEELTRTNSLHYSLFNLTGWAFLARFGRLAGMDLWHARGAGRGSPADAFAYLRASWRAWPHPQADAFDARRLDVLAAWAVQAADAGDVCSDIPACLHPYSAIPPWWPLILDDVRWRTYSDGGDLAVFSRPGEPRPPSSAMLGQG